MKSTKPASNNPIALAATHLKSTHYESQPTTEQQAQPRPVFLTDKQAASRYGISRPTIWRWVNEGRFPAPVKLGPGITRWRLADLLQWEAGVGA